MIWIKAVCGGLSLLLRVLATLALWKWFAVPLGVPELNLAHAWGLAMLASLLLGDAHRQLLFAENYDVPLRKDMTARQREEWTKRELARVFVGLLTWVIYLCLGATAQHLMARP